MKKTRSSKVLPVFPLHGRPPAVDILNPNGYCARRERPTEAMAMHQRSVGERLKCGVPVAVLLILSLTLFTGCQDARTLGNELFNRGRHAIKPRKPFTPTDGITMRSCSLYLTANPNSEVIRKLPPDTPVHLTDKVGEWFKVRTRDGREGFLENKVVGGQEIITKILELRKSIEGIPVQAEGVTKARAKFRLDPGLEHQAIEILAPDTKLEMYERVVTRRAANPTARTPGETERPAGEEDLQGDQSADDAKKDVWYKVKIEDGRVGYLHTQNIKLTPPEDIRGMVTFMRMVAWRSLSATVDPDRGAKYNYLVAYAQIGKDSGCDYTKLYLMTWSSRANRRINSWQVPINGILPITDFQFEGKPGFSVRYLHPSRKDRLIRASFVFTGGQVRKVREEEIPHTSTLH